jgi:5-hydroxyisourate hydrolase
MIITARALDGVYGRSASGVRARLERAVDGHWAVMADAETDGQGFIKDWDGIGLDRGLYRVVFDSDRYFVSLGMNAAYPEIVVTFRIHGEVDLYQVQVMLSPYAYSAHFGSLG